MEKQKVFIPVSVEKEIPPVNFRYGVIIEGGDFVDSSFLTIDKKWVGVGTAKVTHWLNEQEGYFFTEEELEEQISLAFQAGMRYECETNYDNAPSEEQYIKSLNIK